MYHVIIKWHGHSDTIFNTFDNVGKMIHFDIQLFFHYAMCHVSVMGFLC
jgi:hypothetical protein